MMPAPTTPAAIGSFLSLDDVAATERVRVGGKAATLARLRQLGFPVPPGLALPVGASLTKDDAAAVLATLGGSVAVRSSGIAEDGPYASWAGQYLSVLEVTAVDALIDAVERCRASARTVRVAAYAAEHDAALEEIGVLIQAMVPAESAGVAFSADPLTGDVNVVRISATRGLGEALVSGEIVADEWRVDGETPYEVHTPQGAVSRAQVTEIAALARRVAEIEARPQDVEWAVGEGTLYLVQARPIVDLPLKPTIEVPPGTWERDAAHYAGPVSPLCATTVLPLFSPVMEATFAEWGLMPEGFEYCVIGHEAYSRMLPDGGKPPPWWALAVLARVIPTLRKKLAAARRAVDSGHLEAVPASWPALRDELRARIRALADIDLGALTDHALVSHIDEVLAFMSEGQRIHFRLLIPYVVGVHQLVLTCEELLGWDTTETLALLSGTSVATSAPARAIEALAEKVRTHPESRAIVTAPTPDALDRLREVDPELGARFDAYLDAWGLRPLSYDPGQPALIERPYRLVELVRDQLDAPAAADLEATRQALIAETRSQLAPAAQARFDAALATAETVYPQREDNVLYTDNLPAGLMRRAALEVARRLVARGVLDHVEDAGMLELDELLALSQPPEDLAARVDRRRREMAWARANRGPLVYGEASSHLPDVRGLPAAARKINSALLWMASVEFAQPEPVEGDGIGGIPVSPGSYRGRVRVITEERDLPTLRRGEVLVCPITTPAWSMYFSRAGALVTDSGSVLSHAAIIAREHGVPGVVATIDATERLRTGMEVTVDGHTGAVVIH